MLGRLLGALTGWGVGGGCYGESRQDWGYGRGYSRGREYAGSFGGQLPSWADGFLSQSRGVGESATAIAQALGAVRSLFGCLFGSGGGPSWGPSGGSVFDRYRSDPGFQTSPDLGYFLRNRDSVNRVGGIIDQIGRLSPQDRQLLWYGLRSPQAGYSGPSQGGPSPLGLVGDVQLGAPGIVPQLPQRGSSDWVALSDGPIQPPQQRFAPRSATYAGETLTSYLGRTNSAVGSLLG